MTDAIVGVVGCGVTGRRIVDKLVASKCRVATYDPFPIASSDTTELDQVVLVKAAVDLAACDLVVMAHPTPQVELAEFLLASGVWLVSVSDDLADVRALLALNKTAVANDALLIAGAGVAPGLSGLLAHYLVAQLHSLDEIHVAVHGTGGPECARQHHNALGNTALGWHDNEWIEVPGGSGRDLVWFPEPIAARDCYRAALADPLLLQRSFPTADRITARVSATRRDRLTARLPMLLPPHAAGNIGAVRVEARGANAAGGRETVIAGAAGTTADLAAAVAVASALALLSRRGGAQVASGVFGIADQAIDPSDILQRATALGVSVQEFTGVPRPTSW